MMSSEQEDVQLPSESEDSIVNHKIKTSQKMTAQQPKVTIKNFNFSAPKDIDTPVSMKDLPEV